MRRSISYVEPKIALAGDTKTWSFVYTSANDLSKGARFKFDMGSKGRDFDWEIPQTNIQNKKNLIWMETVDKQWITASTVVDSEALSSQFEFLLPEVVKSGDPLTIHIGTPDLDKMAIQGNRAQLHTMRRRPFILYVDPKGKGDFKEKEVFYIDVKGNALYFIRIIVPSIINKNQRFDIIMRFEDRYGNLTGNTPEDTLIELSYERIRDNINWKLFVPETGFINLPNLYFNEAGTYRISLKNLTTHEVFTSSPIRCTDTSSQIYWGVFHNEFVLYDSTEDVEASLRYARDEKGYQFFSTSFFESAKESSSVIWKEMGSLLSEFNEDNRFITFLGMQWAGTPGEEGLRQIVYLKENKTLLKKRDSKTNNLKKIYKSHTSKDFISIPSFTMGIHTLYNFDNFTPEYEKVVEIYNAWGCSECTKKEGNLSPVISQHKKGVKEQSEGSIRRALNNNCRFGFVAGGDDSRGVFSDLSESNPTRYSAGLTAIFATSHSREGLFQALHARSCYATTGPRIIIIFHLAGVPMGSVLTTKEKMGLVYNRHITAYIAGTDLIKEVLIVRNGEPFHTFTPEKNFFEFAFDDDEHIEKIHLKAKKENAFFIYYYLRVLQSDGHIAWASPIWVDHDHLPSSNKKQRKE